MKTRERLGLGLALATALISGVAIFVNGYGVRHVPDATVYTTGKNLVSAVVLLLVVGIWAARRPAPLTRRRSRRQTVGLVAVGVVGGSVPFVLFFEGLARASSTDAAFLQKTLVVWVSLLAVPLLRERVGMLQAVAIALLVVGQAMASGSVSGMLQMPFGRGEVLILAATLLWAVEVVVAKRLLGQLSSWTVGLARMVLGSALLAGWLAVRGRLDVLSGLDAGQWGWVLATGVILAAYVGTWFAALERAPAVDVTAVLVLGAPVTALLGAGIQHTALRPQLDGLGLIALGGLILLGSRLWRPRRASVAR
jgi:drug/metabolite transporter (DMT)-like permease